MIALMNNMKSKGTPEVRSVNATRTATWREMQRSTPELAAKLKERGRINSRKYRLKKKLAAQGRPLLEEPRKRCKDSRAMTGMEKSRAYRARKRSTPEGVELLRAKARENSKRYRMKKKEEEKDKIEVAAALLSVLGGGQRRKEKQQKVPEVVKKESKNVKKKIDTTVAKKESNNVKKKIHTTVVKRVSNNVKKKVDNTMKDPVTGSIGMEEARIKKKLEALKSVDYVVIGKTLKRVPSIVDVRKKETINMKPEVDATDISAGSKKLGDGKRQINLRDGTVSYCGLFDVCYKQETDDEPGVVTDGKAEISGCNVKTEEKEQQLCIVAQSEDSSKPENDTKPNVELDDFVQQYRRASVKKTYTITDMDSDEEDELGALIYRTSETAKAKRVKERKFTKNQFYCES